MQHLQFKDITIGDYVLKDSTLMAKPNALVFLSMLRVIQGRIEEEAGCDFPDNGIQYEGDFHPFNFGIYKDGVLVGGLYLGNVTGDETALATRVNIKFSNLELAPECSAIIEVLKHLLNNTIQSKDDIDYQVVSYKWTMHSGTDPGTKMGARLDGVLQDLKDSPEFTVLTEPLEGVENMISVSMTL